MQTARRHAALLSLAAILGDVGVVAASAAEHVSYGASGVSIEAPGVPGKALLVEMSETMGFELRGAGGLAERQVTVSLRDATVDESVRAVLRALGVDSHALIYDAGGDALNTVVLLSGIPGPTAPPAGPIVSSPVEVRQATVAVAPTPAAATPYQEQVRQRRAAAIARREERRRERRERDPMEMLDRARERAAAKGLSGLKPSE